MSDYAEYYKKAWELSLNTVKEETKTEIERLKSENARLREALEFYASTSSWRGENGEDFKILFEDVSLPNNSSSYVGGRRAREALKGKE